MKTLSVTFYIQRERSPHRPQMQLRPAPLCPISLKTLMVQIQLVVITMMKMKRKHLTSESVQKTAWFELQDFSLYPYIKKNCIQRKWKQIMIAKNQISHLWCTASYKTATSNKLSSLVLHKTTSSGQDSWIRMLVAPARSVAGHLVTSSMFLSWSHVQALPAKAQWINDSCT